MPRMSNKRRLEWSFFLRQVKVGNTTCDRITYHDLCRGCTHSCKQSFRAVIIARTFKSSLLQRWSSSFVAEWNDQKYEITSQKGGYIKVFSCGSAGILAARNCAMLVGDLLVNHM